MVKLKNLENAIVVAVINPDYFGRKVFGLFHVQEQVEETLKVNCFWDLDYPDSSKGIIPPYRSSIKEISIDDIWVCVDSLTEQQQNYLQELKLAYRFHEDSDALERLAVKLDMDRMNVGFDGEAEDGTWFTCCRIENALRGILPKSLHVYSLRSSDEDDSQAASIEEVVCVDHYGDILVKDILPVPVKLEVDPVEYDEEGNIIG